MLRKPFPWILILLTVVLLTGCSSSAQAARSQRTAASATGQQTTSSQAAAPEARSTRQGPGFAGGRPSTTGAADAATDQAATPAPAATETASPGAETEIASTTPVLGTLTDVLKGGYVLTTTTVYLQPDATSEQLGQLETGAPLIVTRALGDWYEVVYNEGGVAHAWTPMAAISFANPTEIAPTPAPVAIVPASATAASAQANQPAVLKASAITQTASATTQMASAITQTGSKLSGKLVFQTSNGGTIYLMNADGSGLRSLTAGFEPALSPDGQQVAFTRWEDQKGLWVINVDGSNEHLVIGADRARSPTWTPDGKSILFERTVESKKCRKTPFGCLTDDELRERFGGEECITDRGRTMCIDDFPVISYNYTNLASYDLATGALHDLPASNLASAPSRSPNQDLVLHLDENGLAATSGASGDQPQRLVQLPGLLGAATYSADGQYIYGSRKSGDHWDIWRWKADGSQPLALTAPPLLRDHPTNNVSPSTSPDGKSVVFLTDRQGKWEMWVMDADGGNQRPLASQTLASITFRYDANNERMVDWGL